MHQSTSHPNKYICWISLDIRPDIGYLSEYFRDIPKRTSDETLIEVNTLSEVIKVRFGYYIFYWIQISTVCMHRISVGPDIRGDVKRRIAEFWRIPYVSLHPTLDLKSLLVSGSLNCVVTFSLMAISSRKSTLAKWLLSRTSWSVVGLVVAPPVPAWWSAAAIACEASRPRWRVRVVQISSVVAILPSWHGNKQVFLVYVVALFPKCWLPFLKKNTGWKGYF